MVRLKRKNHLGFGFSTQKMIQNDMLHAHIRHIFKKSRKSIINISIDIEFWKPKYMRINGVAGGLNKKKGLLECARSSMSYARSQVTCKNAKKSDLDRSISIFEKQNRCASMGWLGVLNTKQVCKNRPGLRWVMLGHRWPAGSRRA